jgi:hypothetical protein
MRKERITGFAGKVDHLELEHVIQIACLAGITATILVRQGNQRYTNPLGPKSRRAAKLVIEYCLEILDESAKKIRGKVSLARLEDALAAQYVEQCENKVY